MPTITKQELLDGAASIRDAVEKNSNSANKVGTLLEDMTLYLSSFAESINNVNITLTDLATLVAEDGVIVGAHYNVTDKDWELIGSSVNTLVSLSPITVINGVDIPSYISVNTVFVDSDITEADIATTPLTITSPVGYYPVSYELNIIGDFAVTSSSLVADATPILTDTTTLAQNSKINVTGALGCLLGSAITFTTDANDVGGLRVIVKFEKSNT